MKINKRKMFRWLVDKSDRLNIWLEDIFKVNTKRKVMEAKQNLVSVKELEQTIGKSLDIGSDTEVEEVPNF